MYLQKTIPQCAPLATAGRKSQLVHVTAVGVLCDGVTTQHDDVQHNHVMF